MSRSWLVVVFAAAFFSYSTVNGQPFQIQGFVDVDNYHVLFTGDPSGDNLTFQGQGEGPYEGTYILPTEHNFTTSVTLM